MLTGRSAGTGVEEDISYPQFLELLAALAEHATRYETELLLLDRLLNLFMGMDSQSPGFSKKEFSVFQYVRRAMSQRLRERRLAEAADLQRDNVQALQSLKGVLVDGDA